MMHEAHPSDCRSPDRKCCSGCGEIKPIDEFRRKRRDSDRRETRCRTCHARYMSWYRRTKKELALKGFAKQAQWRTNSECLAAMVKSVTEQFGGLQAFARACADFYRELARDPKCSREAAEGYLAVARLVLMLSKQRSGS